MSDLPPENRTRPEPRLVSLRPAYGRLRARVCDILRSSPRHSYARWAIWPLTRIPLAVIDLALRWITSLFDTFFADRGYITAGSIAAAYLAWFGLIDSKSTQEETRASTERSLFMTLVSAGNAPSFVAAMKTFGPVQTIQVTEHPHLFTPWKWGRTYLPNQQPLWEWARSRLQSCEPQTCSLHGESRIDLREANLFGADLRDTDLNGANLFHADLSKANLILADLREANLTIAKLLDANLIDANLFHADLTQANLIDAKLFDTTLTSANLTGALLQRAYLIRAQLTGATLIGADLKDARLNDARLTKASLSGARVTDADLKGADLRGARVDTNLDDANVTGAVYNSSTRFPTNFDPQAHGMVTCDMPRHPAPCDNR
jgi:hypothetical protein